MKSLILPTIINLCVSQTYSTTPNTPNNDYISKVENLLRGNAELEDEEQLLHRVLGPSKDAASFLEESSASESQDRFAGLVQPNGDVQVSPSSSSSSSHTTPTTFQDLLKNQNPLTTNLISHDIVPPSGDTLKLMKTQMDIKNNNLVAPLQNQQQQQMLNNLNSQNNSTSNSISSQLALPGTLPHPSEDISPPRGDIIPGNTLFGGFSNPFSLDPFTGKARSKDSEDSLDDGIYPNDIFNHPDNTILSNDETVRRDATGSSDNSARIRSIFDNIYTPIGNGKEGDVA